MEALMRIEEDEKLKEMLAERKHRLNANFVWTPENKQKIIELNNGLLERYREAYNESGKLFLATSDLS